VSSINVVTALGVKGRQKLRNKLYQWMGERDKKCPKLTTFFVL